MLFVDADCPVNLVVTYPQPASVCWYIGEILIIFVMCLALSVSDRVVSEVLLVPVKVRLT